MSISCHTAAASGKYAGLHFIDGTSSQSSYVAVARRGNIFLGVRFTGLTDGKRMGVDGTTYLHARVRSARDQALAEKLDLENGSDNVINLHTKQLALDETWPGFTFEKIDAERASLIVGMFISRSLIHDAEPVIARIEKDASLIRRLVDYVMVRAGQEYGIARAKVAAMWMLDQAKPKLDEAKKAAEYQKIILKAQTEFAGQVEGQLEVVGPHLQQINTIYHKHQQLAGAG